MAIISAAIESNGWVLAVRGDWAATGGAWEYGGQDRANGRYLNGGVDQFPLEPDGAAAVVVQLASAGYDRVDGRAVANAARPRAIVATKALRRPYPDQLRLDETDHGDGTRTVRLALSDRVYASCVVTGATFRAGWKAGEGGAQIGVANGSARGAPVPIVRCAVLPFTLVRGQTHVHMDWIVATHHPENFGAELHQPVAATRVVASDGVNSVETWLAGLRTSPLYGDGLRCVGGAVNLAGLNAGVVTLVATFHPWIGAARTIGAGHVATVTPWSTSAEEPVVLCYDPAGSRYAARHVFVNEALGTTVAAAVTVAGDLAGAKAGVPAASISVAMQALYIANITLAAANGQPGGARSCDWCVITLGAGVSGFGAQVVTTGFGAKEGLLVIQGDPDDADPRANCILRSGAVANPALRNGRYLLRNLTVEAGQQILLSATNIVTENIRVRAKAGYEADGSTMVFYASVTDAAYNQAHANLRWEHPALALSGSGQRAGLLRNVVTTFGVVGTTAIGVRRLASAGLLGGVFIGFRNQTTDQMAWNCTGMGLTSKALSWAPSSGSATQASPTTHMRLALVNCLFERAGPNNENFFSVGETGYSQVCDSLFEGNSFVGQRVNLHNDSPSPHADLRSVGNASRNNVWDWQATKHDTFKSDGSLTGSWEWLYGVGHSSNVHLLRTAADANNFSAAHHGLRAAADLGYAGNGSNAFPRFVDDRCQYGPQRTASTGWGDYRPDSGSPMPGRAVQACVDAYAGGAGRGARFASGGLAAAQVPATRLSPVPAAHAMAAGRTAVRIAFAVRGAGAAHMHRAAVAGLRTDSNEKGRAAPRTFAVDADARRMRVGAE